MALSTGTGTHWKGPLYVGGVQVVDENGQIVAPVDLGDFLDVNGNEILELDAVASAVNNIGVGNAATGTNPFIYAAGEADTGITLKNSEGEEIAIFDSVATSVNELTISSAASGNGPILAATGDGTNIDVTLKGKGTGSVLLGQATATSVKLVADQPLTDSNGNELFKFVATGSAVNELTLTNAATTGTVDLTVTGSDTVVAALNIGGKAGGASGVAGGAATLKAGAGHADGNSTGGAAALTGGSGSGTSAGGAVTLTSGASENGTAVTPGASGAINLTVGTPGTATTGVGGAGGAVGITGVAGGASTGASSTGGAGSSVTLTAGAGGASSGGTDTGGKGGDIVQTAGAGGTGATAGKNGAFYHRATDGAGYFLKMPAPAAKTTNATLTVAEMLGGWITVDGSGSATSTQTTPSGTDLAAAFPGVAAGDCFDFHIINISTDAAETAILGFGSDITGVGSMIVSDNAANNEHSSGIFRFRYSGANVWVAYRLG